MATAVKKADTLSASEKAALAKVLGVKAPGARKATPAKKATTKVAAKVVEKASPAPIQSEIRFDLQPYGEGVGIDVRTWRLIKGEWVPGKGMRFPVEAAAFVIEGIQAQADLAGE